MKQLLVCAATACLTLSACSGGGGAPDSVDRMARSEVEAIVKEYLVSNPEVLQAALVEVEALERDQKFVQLLSAPGDPTIGPADAPITIVEFFDYNCGYCRQANDWLFEQVDDRRGDVRVVFKEYPILAQSSLDATKAAMAAERQGKYREMHIALMKSPDVTAERISSIAKSIGLDERKFTADMEDPAILEHVQRIYAEAEAVGVNGTPGFFVNGAFQSGFREDVMEAMLETARSAL